jgi:hypothetical protein
VRTDDLSGLKENVPVILDAKGHAVVDYITAGTFIALGFAFLKRNPRASTLAFLHGGGVLLTSLLTDYPGGVWRKLSFQTHRTMDMMQAGLVGAGPTLMGFADTTEAQVFRGQAVLESGVIAATDWTTA